MNLFSSFKLFEQEEEAKDKFVSTVKDKLKVDKNLWLGMPLLLSNKEIGDHKIVNPTMCYVTDYDENSVTFKNYLMPEDKEGWDDDDELNPDNKEAFEITVSLEDFFNLQEPEGMEQGGGEIGGLL